MLDHPRFFDFAADHIAGRIVQVEEGRVRLAAGLDEVRGLVRASRIDGAVVGDDSDSHALDPGMTTHRGAAIILAELEEIRVVANACDDLLHVDRALVVHRHDAKQFFAIQAWWFEVLRRIGRHVAVPVDLPQHFAGDANGIAIVFGQIVPKSRDGRVHDGAAQFFFGRDFTGGSHQQWWSGEESARAAAHHDDVVGQAGLVGATGGRGSMRYRDHGQAGGRHER